VKTFAIKPRNLANISLFSLELSNLG